MNESLHICMVCHLRPSDHYCDCKHIYTYVCSGCMVTHSQEPEQHNFKSYNSSQSSRVLNVRNHEAPQSPPRRESQPASSNEYCTICHTQPAVLICFCQAAHVCLCRDCVPAHQLKYESDMHQTIPIREKERANRPGYLESLSRRKFRLNQRKLQLRANVDRISSCVADVTQKCQLLVDQLLQYRDSLISQLTKAREDLEALFQVAETEADNNLFDEGYRANDLVASMLLADDEQSLESTFFEFFLHFDQSAVPTVFELHFEVSGVNQTLMGNALQVPWFTSNSLKLWDPERRAWGAPWTFAKTFIDNHSSVVGLPDGSWLASGSTTAITQVLQVDPVRKSIQPFASLRTPRFGHGLLSWKNFVYAFGGYDLKSSERIRLSAEAREWESLPDMTFQRRFFNPSAHGHTVYLCGGDGTNTVETFDTIAKRFEILRGLELPHKTNTCSVVYKGKLIIFQDDKMVKWQLGSTDRPEIVKKKITDSSYCFSSVGGLLSDSHLYIAMFYKKTLVQVDLASLTGAKISI